MAKSTLLEIVQDEKVPRSTKWARKNKEKVKAQYEARKGTLDGKLINLVTSSKYRAKKNNWGHNINTNYLRGLYEGQEGRCALSGKIMTIKGERGSEDYWNSISVDRINSSLGYVKGNVQLVCTGVNYMKKDMTEDMFINFCHSVVENFNG